LMHIAGVNYGTCMQTAEDMALEMNPGEDINHPGYGETYILPAELIPAADATTTTAAQG
jgi:hypothetical protein